jgi:hypothetical protein
MKMITRKMNVDKAAAAEYIQWLTRRIKTAPVEDNIIQIRCLDSAKSALIAANVFTKKEINEIVASAKFFRNKWKKL